MKNHPLVEEALRDDHAIRAVPELIVDWNMNRYFETTASNVLDEEEYGFDVEFFPIESIAEPNRPLKGANKARIGTSLVSSGYIPPGNSFPPRYYIASADDMYKYWTSPNPSSGTGFLSNCRPQIMYEDDVPTNKIVITTENSWATARNFEIQTTTIDNPSDANWTTIATQASVGNSWKASGQIILYWNGISWVVGEREDNPDGSPRFTTIRGVRLVVTGLEGGYERTNDGTLVQTRYYPPNSSTFTATNGIDAHFDLIEISARLEVNLSKNVINVNSDSEFSEVSALYPIGTLTSNAGSITLSNLYENSQGEWVPGLFNYNNEDSPYRRFIDANAEFSLSYLYYDEDGHFLDRVPDFVMYADAWTGQAEDEVEVELRDYSKFFNEETIPAAMWENLSVPEIIWRIMDMVGFSDYIIDRDIDLENEHIIPVFYTTGEQTTWEVLDELAQASQTAIYFDSMGRLRVKTRRLAFSEHDAPVANLTSETSPTQLANIETLEENIQFEPNRFKVLYQKTNWSPDNNGQPTMQRVWEPEDTVTLRAAPLTKTLWMSDNYFHIHPNDARTLPFEGYVNIEGEIIKYEGKRFTYRTRNGTMAFKDITSQSEHRQRNSETPVNFRGGNKYTGEIRIVERGAWNTEPKQHHVDLDGYTVRNVNPARTTYTWNNVTHLKAQSMVRIEANDNFNEVSSFIVLTRGVASDSHFLNYGTRMRFVKRSGNKHQQAGIVINNAGSNENGYYIEITPSNSAVAQNRNEIAVFVRNGGGFKELGTRAAIIVEELEYELDVSFKVNSNGTHTIGVWLNGKNAMFVNVAGSDRVSPNGRFGMFTRGRTGADFEYFYGVRREQGPDLPEDFSFLNKVARGYTGQQYEKEWLYGWRTQKRRGKKKAKKTRWNVQYMDDFGPYVHEVREYNVKFEPNPVLHSRLYMSNDWNAAVLEYNATPFDARFVIANTARINAVVNGEDTLSIQASGEAIGQTLTVFGRALIIAEAEEVIAENVDQIRRRGKNESEISSPWIQSKQMANDVAQWLRENFSYGNDNITVTIFGNPLIELGDVVHVTYPDKHIDSDFFVVGVSNSFDAGIETSLTLRRRI